LGSQEKCPRRIWLLGEMSWEKYPRRNVLGKVSWEECPGKYVLGELGLGEMSRENWAPRRNVLGEFGFLGEYSSWEKCHRSSRTEKLPMTDPIFACLVLYIKTQASFQQL